MKSTRYVYPVVTVTFMLDDGEGAINHVYGGQASRLGVKIDDGNNFDLLTPDEISHVLSTTGQILAKATDNWNMKSKEIVRDDF